MSATLEDRIAKLPTWAQQHIENLARETRIAEDKAAQLYAEQPKSDVWVEHGYREEDRQYIAEPFAHAGMHTTVVFRLAVNERSVDALISVRIKDGGLEVMATGYPHGLMVRPQASNVIQVGAER